MVDRVRLALSDWNPGTVSLDRVPESQPISRIKGTAHPDPGWDGKLQFSKQHDQGVVVLDQAATTKWPGITPAPLLPVGFLDANQRALKNETFTLVGYGVDIGPKKAQIVNQQRMSTTAPLQSVQREVVAFQKTRRRAAGRASATLAAAPSGTST